VKHNRPDLSIPGEAICCKQGHELSGANLYVSPKGRRYCRTCRAFDARRYNERDVHCEKLSAIRAHFEAKALFRMIGRNGETVDSVRELILVDEESLKSLLAFLAAEPKEFRWVMEALRFRDLVLEQFDQLTNDFGRLRKFQWQRFPGRWFLESLLTR
jgi:hypothetical protein